jgi:hypothetical protein
MISSAKPRLKNSKTVLMVFRNPGKRQVNPLGKISRIGAVEGRKELKLGALFIDI